LPESPKLPKVEIEDQDLPLIGADDTDLVIGKPETYRGFTRMAAD
jgi:hypothetical protein